MFDKLKNNKIKIIGGLLLSLIFFNLNALAVKAQSNESESLKDLETESASDWNFTSENETISVEDEIKELENYNISESDDLDVEITEEQRRWNNPGYGNKYIIETEVKED